MNKLSQSFFYFTKAEQRGIFVILSISMALLIIPGFLRSINHNPIILHEGIAPKETSFIKAINEKTSKGHLTNSTKDAGNLLHKLDINSVSKAELMQLGISKRSCNTIIKYREKGGVFKNIQSLRKVYNITEKEFSTLSKVLAFDSDSNTLKQKSIQYFDPNTVTKEELLSMGIRLRLVQTMINFRSKGFKFRDKGDITKIYGITEDEIKSILPKIKFENNSLLPEAAKSISSNKPIKQLVEINTAGLADLDELRGIGASWANKIMKFRDALGGFYSVEQIRETRGMDDSLARLVIRQISCNGVVKKLIINSATYEDLAKHPYISGKQAAIILNYIKQHGKLNNISEMQKILAFTPSDLKKLEPYLELNDINY